MKKKAIDFLKSYRYLHILFRLSQEIYCMDIVDQLLQYYIGEHLTKMCLPEQIPIILNIRKSKWLFSVRWKKY